MGRKYQFANMIPQVVSRLESAAMARKNISVPQFMQYNYQLPLNYSNNLQITPLNDTFTSFGYEDKFGIIIENVYTKDECNEIIELTESQEYEPALVNIGGGEQIRADHFRNSQRVMFDSSEMAFDIFRRIGVYIPNDVSHTRNYYKFKLNERLRFLKYGIGEYFVAHTDGRYNTYDLSQQSLMTLLLYLNDLPNDIKEYGGQTILHDSGCPGYVGQFIDVVPKAGKILVFDHTIKHESATLKKGNKYVMRTDVMFANFLPKPTE
eukprot:242263_1